LAAGGGDALYAGAFQRIILPILEAYSPQLVLVSAGFDASARDPLAQMEVSASAFGWMARELARVADRSGDGRIAMVLEGGYDLGAIESGVRSALDGALLGRAVDVTPIGHDEALDRAARSAHEAWPAVG
jgi:acetoin utilization deacetylase AcuC-like enzyme